MKRFVLLAVAAATCSSAAGAAVTVDSAVAEFDAAALEAAVPEPATWMMLALGMFGVGFAVRRRPAEPELRIRFT